MDATNRFRPRYLALAFLALLATCEIAVGQEEGAAEPSQEAVAQPEQETAQPERPAGQPEQETTQPEEEAAQPAVPTSLSVEPESLHLKIGQSAQLKATARDASGAAVEASPIFTTRARGGIEVNNDGTVTARSAGEHVVTVILPRPGRGAGRRGRGRRGRLPRVTVNVTVEPAPLKSIEFPSEVTSVYEGTTVALRPTVMDEVGEERGDVALQFTSSDPRVASINALGQLTAHRTGKVTIHAAADSISTEKVFDVLVNPVRELTLAGGDGEFRTGDVIAFTAVARDSLGRPVTGLPIYYACFRTETEESRSEGAASQIDQRGRFVAEKPGEYTILAATGNTTAQKTVRVVPRNVRMRVEVVGQGRVDNVHTSDLWVWQGVDGRDYCVSGTWGADGEAYFWDVSDPANIKKIGTFQVDARTVNDVKVSPDGRICVISREGASNRRNGLVVLDVSDPHDVKQLAAFDDGLTGGVHNVFVDNGFIYAINNGRRYDVIDIHNPSQPHRVANYELDTPNHGVHDVWVVNGIAYSSNWANGVHVVDVGNGIVGGSPQDPQLIESYIYPQPHSHAAFPFYSSSTGRFYVLGGDEIFSNGLNPGQPMQPAGYIHFVDMTAQGQPAEVARYEVPEAGSHNLWVEDDKLYVAYYNAGLRVVDISGDLMGDLYRQGREIASFRTFDPEGFVPNAPMAWGPQPYKGLVFVSDFDSGIWALRLVPEGSRGRRGRRGGQ